MAVIASYTGFDRRCIREARRAADTRLGKATPDFRLSAWLLRIRCTKPAT